jgi:hypothetical protein
VAAGLLCSLGLLGDGGCSWEYLRCMTASDGSPVPAMEARIFNSFGSVCHWNMILEIEIGGGTMFLNCPY